MDMQLRTRMVTSSARVAAWQSTAQTRSLPRGCLSWWGMLPRRAGLDKPRHSALLLCSFGSKHAPS